nr:S-layer homology domain-containing protein [uncultured Agathobaculum sp.]
MMKTGKNKRLLASILAASMLLAMSPFALADENTQDTTDPGQPAEQTCAAKIGETEYSTLAGAIYDANSDVTIVMLRDVTENIKINKSLTLDLGEHTLSGNANAAVVTISGDETQVTVENGTVTGGKKSGIRITDADVTLTKLTVTKNASTGNGGGIDAMKGKELVVEQCAINENTAKDKGGGIHVEDTPLKVVGSKIENNQGLHGAGINLSDTKTPVCGRHEITGTLIEGNKVLNAYGTGGGIHVGTRSQVNIENSTISKNAADQGGGILAFTADSVILNHVVITENQANVGAGILTLTMNACNTEFKLTNNTEVKNNTATYYGGGVMAWGDGSGGIEQVVTVENSSISNNNAKDGAGIFINFEDTATNAFVTINLGVGAVVQENKATRNGGGIFARNLGDTAVSKGTINVAEGSAVYNNTATAAGDDLYLNNDSTFTLPNAKAMSGDRILSSDKTEITGWYHDGYKWNAAANNGQGDFEKIGRWTAETADEYIPVKKDSHAVSLKAATKKSSGGTEDTDPIEWNVSRSKTATQLDTNTWTSNVTLSLPSAEEALASDVVFVLDKSTSTKLEEQALGMLNNLKEQAASTKAKVKVGVVIFNKQANKTAPLTDLATGYDDIQAAIEQTISSGTNTHAGLLAGKQMLDEDKEVAANRKYLIFVSDGITYMYNAEPTATAWSFKADFWKHWAGPDNWSSKNGNDNPPADWTAWMDEIGKKVEAQGTEYEYPYGGEAKKWTPEDETYTNYANSIDKALYLTYQVYQEAQAAGYNCYAVVNENDKTAKYPWGPAFMRYLANGQTVDFGKIQNDILYAVSAGSTVEDQMGDAFDFVPGSLKLTVGGKELKSKADGNMTYFGNNAENLSENNCRFKVLYAPDADGFVWTINEHVSNFEPVQLTYTVKLTKPETDPGTYGTEDLKGEKNVPAEKALFTNKRAVLNAINSAGAPLNPLDFPKPSVSYTVKKSSSGGGGGGSHKPTVTIPDDVPTGLNGDDHYAYIVGYPNGNVEPNGNITRAEVATIFFRLLTEEVRTANSTQSNSLSDVTRGQWFNHAVSTLSSMGIVKGHNDGTFAPNAPITRAEFAAIAARFDDKNTDTSSKFTDIASHWAKNEIGIAANKGWINGYPDGTFRPNQYITRAEAMTLVNRVLNRLPENSSDLLDSMIKWPDNSDASAWYYLAVQEATNSHYYKTKENKFEKWTELRETRDWTKLEK